MAVGTSRKAAAADRAGGGSMSRRHSRGWPRTLGVSWSWRGPTPGVRRRPCLSLLDQPRRALISADRALDRVLAGSSVSQARARAPQRGRFIKAMRNGRVSPQTAPAPVKRPRAVTWAFAC